jgi:lipopolysaccharide transport system ATP-binding protein
MLEVGTGFNGELTGRENVYMNGAILGMTKAEIDEKMEEIIEFSEVREFIDTPVKRYSSGMFVKLAFSVAAHLNSEIMIMDEVLAVGDMAFQTKCLDKMREASSKEGRTVLYVSHNMNTIRKLCDRCIVLDKGKVIFEGDVDSAIAVYMNTGERIAATDINLAEKRMDHLPSKAEVKMQRLTLVGKESPIYDFRETINFDLYLKADRSVKNLCIRFEIRSYDGISIGSGILNNFTDLDISENQKLSFSFALPGLVPGDYNVLIVVYEKNEYGVYNDLDAVYPTFDFSVVDNNDALKINWNTHGWGRLKFDSLKYHCDK